MTRIKRTLEYRARAAAGAYTSFTRNGGKNMWLKGHAAGVRDAHKQLRPLKFSLHAALVKADEQHERARKAEHEWNIKRLQLERKIQELHRTEQRLRSDDSRRASIVQSRIPANNGGFAR